MDTTAPSYSQLELSIREAWAGDVSRSRHYPGVLPERLENLAAQPFRAKQQAAQAVRAAALALGIHP